VNKKPASVSSDPLAKTFGGPMTSPTAGSQAAALPGHEAGGADVGADPRLLHALRQQISAAGGWIGVDAFMATALYHPGLGYYSRGDAQIGRLPAGAPGAPDAGSDFATAPVISPLFGRVLAAQVAQALEASQTDTVWEFGAGTGSLAAQVLEALDALRPGLPPVRWHIVELSAGLRMRQQQHLARFCDRGDRGDRGDRVAWLDTLPEQMAGVVLGNEVLDAMPVKLLARTRGVWHERGVCVGTDGALYLADRPTELRPPQDVPGEHDYLTEIHPQAEAFIATLAQRLHRGLALFIDYGFPQAEYYHPQRHMGTLVAHRQHRVSANWLAHPGQQDITAHVNFTGIALAAQEGGWNCVGYTSQGRFLLNSGLAQALQSATPAEQAMALKLVHEHEMGELFKVIAFEPSAKPNTAAATQTAATQAVATATAQSAGTSAVTAPNWQPLGFTTGDRTHTL
jgi:SAM-dependent MidA family methyltransferase